jgi:nucleoside-triphosphatase THEP1
MNRIILIAGNKNSGKTTFLKQLIESVTTQQHLRLGGFIAEGIIQSGRKTGFILIDVVNNIEKLLCSEIPRKGWEKMGRFYFDPAGFLLGERILSNLPDNTDCVIVDEYGPLELEGKGWDHGIREVLSKSRSDLILTVRQEILPEVVDRFNGYEMHVFNINQNRKQIILREIQKLITF